MEIPEYKNIYINEGGHFFYISTHQLVISIIRIIINPKKKLNILDAGCGTGMLAKKLQRFGIVTGIDINIEALKFARLRGITVKKASIEKLPFKDGSFDVIVSIDVLTHRSIKNDLIPLREFYRVLKPEGFLILRVSANSWLKLIHDKHVHMKHRYGKDELFKKLKTAGFSILKLSFINSILFPPMILKYILEKLVKPKVTKSAITKVNPTINNLLIKALRLESNIFIKINIPFGIGLVAVAKKPKN